MFNEEPTTAARLDESFAHYLLAIGRTRPNFLTAVQRARCSSRIGQITCERWHQHDRMKLNAYHEARLQYSCNFLSLLIRMHDANIITGKTALKFPPSI